MADPPQVPDAPVATAARRRRIPPVDRLLAAPEVAPLLAEHPRERVVTALRRVLDELRRELLAAREPGEGSDETDRSETDRSEADLTGRIAARLERRLAPFGRARYRRVINATGVVLHTGLGRAPLAPEAARAVAELAPRYQRLEVDLETGERGGRDRGCELALRELLGAEAATVVNNNAAATLLALAALARGRRVLLSRGELVEIGGSYRVPEVIAQSGAVLEEVGTTNRTHRGDYEAPFDEAADATPPVGLLLKVHTSNYRLVGFTAEVPLEELVALGQEKGVPVVHDLGSGCLVDLEALERRRSPEGEPALRGEHLAARSLAAGADLVCFSGDKLLGGPQAGILAGTREAVDACRRHPLYRALRPGRLIYTALEATLDLYLRGDESVRTALPVLSRLTEPAAETRRRAEQLLAELDGALDRPLASGAAGPPFTRSLVPSTAEAGSGSFPARPLDSWAVALTPSPEAGSGSLEALATALRQGDPAVLARREAGALLLDVKAVADDEILPLARALAQGLSAGSGPG